MRLRALDLFCCAGGAGMGLHRAGFEVVGVDIKPQPRYPFSFVCDNAFGFLTDVGMAGFDFIWASPPCQDYSSLKGLATQKRPRLIPAVRELLKRSGQPYCIENVVGSELENPIILWVLSELGHLTLHIRTQGVRCGAHSAWNIRPASEWAAR